jgi:hypothetical protein
MDYQFQRDLAEGMWLDDPNLEMLMRAVSLSSLFVRTFGGKTTLQGQLFQLSK